MRSALILTLAVAIASAASVPSNLTAGKADMKSAGPLAFGPDGVLFAGDPMGPQYLPSIQMMPRRCQASQWT